MKEFRTSSISGSRMRKRRVNHSLPSRIAIQLPCFLALFVLLKIISPSFHHQLMIEFRRSRYRGALRPVRPETLRRHLSMVLPLSKFCRGSTFLDSQLHSACWQSLPLRPPASRRRQEVNRVHDRHGLHAILWAKIDCLDAVYYQSDEVRCIHVSRLQLAHRHGAVRLNRQLQHHLALQGRIAAQFPVVIPVESRLITVEHNLYFFIGAGSSWPTVRFGTVAAAADSRDRAGRAG